MNGTASGEARGSERWKPIGYNQEITDAIS